MQSRNGLDLRSGSLHLLRTQIHKLVSRNVAVDSQEALMKFLLVLSIVLLPIVPFHPVISSKNGEEFLISFEVGADKACTVFEQRGTDYKPFMCWQLIENATAYEETWFEVKKADTDWEVYSLVGYPRGDKYLVIESNHLKVHR